MDAARCSLQKRPIAFQGWLPAFHTSLHPLGQGEVLVCLEAFSYILAQLITFLVVATCCPANFIIPANPCSLIVSYVSPRLLDNNLSEQTLENALRTDSEHYRDNIAENIQLIQPMTVLASCLILFPSSQNSAP